ncbi:MAG: nucleoside triphosphate hydrolase [Candidatus Omnitrophica bacterium]|nr:nucleoside triphosphate hydrolase [Candidatus Omnitrophota bacterium]
MPRLRDPFWRLVQTARTLQGPGGCPWDRAQTVSSLLPHLVEEVWEAWCAGGGRRRDHLQEELGDVIYTVVFIALLAERRGWFELRSMLEATAAKMVRRHPHVFGGKSAHTADEAYDAWQAAKHRERRGRRRAAVSQTAIRSVLIEICDLLRADPGSVKALNREVAALRTASQRRANGRPTQASDTPARASRR